MARKSTKKKTEETAPKTYFLCDGKVYRETDNGLYTGAEEVKIETRKHPFQWKGGLLTVELYWQIISFFYAGYKKTDSENLVYLYYDVDSHEWMLWAPPQQCNGMTVKADSTTQEYQAQRKLIPERFVQLGTFHHHCGGSAFASGTDKDDEEDRDGLHVTIGGIGQTAKPLSIHARATFKGVTYDTEIENWIAMPDWVAQAPDHMQWDIMGTLLRHPQPNDTHPEWWLENAEKKTWTAGYHRGQSHFTDWDEDYFDSATTNGKQKNNMGTTALDEKDIKDLIAVTRICKMDPDLVEDLMSDPPQTWHDDSKRHALREIFLGECRKRNLFQYRILYLMNTYDVFTFCTLKELKKLEQNATVR